MISPTSVFGVCFWIAGGSIGWILMRYALSLRGNLSKMRDKVDEKNRLDTNLNAIKHLYFQLAKLPCMVSTMLNSRQLNDCNQSIGAIEMNNNAVTNAQDLMNIEFLDQNDLPLCWDNAGISLARIFRIEGDGWRYRASFNGSTWRLSYDSGRCKEKAEQLNKDIEKLKWHITPMIFFRSHGLFRISVALIICMIVMLVLLNVIIWK